MLFCHLSRNSNIIFITLENMPPSQKEHNMLCSFRDGIKRYLEREIDISCISNRLKVLVNILKKI